ncbi:MAG: DUF1460 domain-containing protein [Bacteroidales bacterium]|nr:DUF1460 domain-containing protein [Bacteroidales bacterium]
MKNGCVLFLFFLLSLPLQSQTGIEQYITLSQSYKSSSRPERLLRNALLFLGKPYVGGVLEKEPEHLVIQPDSLDCLTFIEYALALTLANECSDASPACFNQILRQIRYRNGTINDYADRLHYTLDWSMENCKHNRLENITDSFPSISVTKDINFISTHKELYKALAKHPGLLEKIKAAEQNLSRLLFSFIPEDSIPLCEKNIHNGDIILFTSTIPGLDIAHLGFAYHNGDTLSFIHASSDAGQVIINPVSLSSYCKKMKRIGGIMILRIKEAETGE